MKSSIIRAFFFIKFLRFILFSVMFMFDPKGFDFKKHFQELKGELQLKKLIQQVELQQVKCSMIRILGQYIILSSFPVMKL